MMDQLNAVSKPSLMGELMKRHVAKITMPTPKTGGHGKLLGVPQEPKIKSPTHFHSISLPSMEKFK